MSMVCVTYFFNQKAACVLQNQERWSPICHIWQRTRSWFSASVQHFDHSFVTGSEEIAHFSVQLNFASTKLGKYLENEGQANSHRDRILSTLTMGSQCLTQLSSFPIYFQVDLNSKLMVNFWLPTIWPSSQWLLWHCGIGLSENWKSTACLTIPHFSAGANFLGIDAKNNAGTCIYAVGAEAPARANNAISQHQYSCTTYMCLCLG